MENVLSISLMNIKRICPSIQSITNHIISLYICSKLQYIANFYVSFKCTNGRTNYSCYTPFKVKQLIRELQEYSDHQQLLIIQIQVSITSSSRRNRRQNNIIWAGTAILNLNSFGINANKLWQSVPSGARHKFYNAGTNT